MHSTTMTTSTPSSSSSSSSATTTTNPEQYHYSPPVATLRRASRPSNIDLSIFDHHHHNQQSNDLGINSAPIYYLKQTNNPHQHLQHTSDPYTATFQYRPQQLQQQQHQQHTHVPSHHHSHQQSNIHLYQQQQQLVDPFTQHQHTPHTFPLQASPNHYHQYFYFPPSSIAQVNITSNGGHQASNTNQSSTPTHNNRLRAVQMQEQQWSNPVLSPLMVKRMNENPSSIPIDDDEDPSASIDALVADVDSNSEDLLDDQRNKSVNESKTTSTTHAGPRSPSPHIYIRSTSHILTTPPNPLASDDHPDNQLTIGNNTFQKTFSPIPSAGFELTTTTNPNLKISSNVSTDRTYFNFDTNILEQRLLQSQHTDDMEGANHDNINKSHMINSDVRTANISSNHLIQNDNSNPSSTNSTCQNPSSRTLSQILQSSEQRRSTSSSSSLSTDVKFSSVDPGNNHIHGNTMTSQQQNRHCCTHPECNKIFANKSALAKHKLTHSQDRKHKCPKCNKGFKRLDHLHGHMLTHEEEKPHKCRVPNCNRTYCDARSLKRHIENSHQDVLAAIHDGGHEDYKTFLPETAFVKTKDLSLNSEFSIDSVDSNSPRSLIDNEQSFNIRASTGSKTMMTYTFDEEKYIECQICKKTFKSGAALNGHMRLHGGFNEKQPSPSSSGDNTPKKKRSSTTTATKRKRIDSPSTMVSIKKEEQDVSMIPSTNNLHHYHQQHHQHQQQQAPFLILPSSSDVHQQPFHDRTISSRSRSASSSVIATPSTSFPSYTIRNPHSVQPSTSTKQSRKQSPLSTHGFDQSRVNISNGMMQINSMGHLQTFPNTSTPQQLYEDKVRKPLSSENYAQNQQMNGLPSHYTHTRPLSHQQPSTLPQFQTTPSSSNSLSTNLLQHLFRQKGELLNQDFYLQRQSSSALESPMRYTPPPPPPPSSQLVHSSIPNSTSSIVNTPVTSPYSTFSTSHLSPQIYNNNNNNNASTIIHNDMQPSPATHSTPSSCSSTSSSSSHIAPKKRILNAIKQENHDEKSQVAIEEEPDVLTIIPDLDSPVQRKVTSGFFIGTPSSTGASSSSSTSSTTHFNYENILPPPPSTATIRESTPSSFHWPSQFRRQLSLNTGRPTLNPPPPTPYTPPPMLSPFRKGPGLYYRVFSQPGSSGETPSIPTTPILSFTPGGDESAGPKINIGRDYQAIIPKLRTEMDDNHTEITGELLFSPAELTSDDEKSLEKFEQLTRMNPFLFSPRHSSASYSFELVYMLLHEYNGNLQRTLAALLEGTATDIKQCRPLHRYRFPECDYWTKEEMDAFAKALQVSEKNFQLISQAVGTKTVKQCIEFYYMPKVNITPRKLLPAGTSSVMTRRKRFQLIKSQQQQQQQLDDETSSSSFNDFRIDEDGSTMNSDSPYTAHFSCDIDECSQTFTSERACRAHRKDHRRPRYNLPLSTNIKRSRNVDVNK